MISFPHFFSLSPIVFSSYFFCTFLHHFSICISLSHFFILLPLYFLLSHFLWHLTLSPFSFAPSRCHFISIFLKLFSIFVYFIPLSPSFSLSFNDLFPFFSLSYTPFLFLSILHPSFSLSLPLIPYLFLNTIFVFVVPLSPLMIFFPRSLSSTPLFSTLYNTSLLIIFHVHLITAK